MQNNEKNYEGAEGEGTKKTKRIIFKRREEFGKGSFIYDVSKKSLNFGPSLPLTLYTQTSNFVLSTSHSSTSLIGIQPLPLISEFSSKTLTMRST